MMGNNNGGMSTMPMTMSTPTPSVFTQHTPSRSRSRAASAAARIMSHQRVSTGHSTLGTLSTPSAMDLKPASSHPLARDNAMLHHRVHAQQPPQPFANRDASPEVSRRRVTRTSTRNILRSLRSRATRSRTKSAAGQLEGNSNPQSPASVSTRMRYAPRRPHQSYTAYRREQDSSKLAKLKSKHSSSASTLSVSGVANMGPVPTTHRHPQEVRARSHTVPSAFSLAASHSSSMMGPVMTHPATATGTTRRTRHQKSKIAAAAPVSASSSSLKSAFLTRSVSPDLATPMMSCDHDLDTQALIRTEEIDRSKLKVKPDSELYDPAVLRRLVLLTQAACPLDVNELNLRRCAINGDADGIKDLLTASGVNPNAADTGGWSALILASRYGFLDAVRVLLGFGADINQETNEGWTALMYAVYNKHAEIVEVLLQHDDPPRLQHGTKTNAGWTALMYATYIGSKEIMEILVHKAEPPAHILFETAKGASAVTCARMKRRKDLKEFLQREAKFQRKDLVVRGIDSAYGNWVPLDIAKLIAEFTTWY